MRALLLALALGAWVVPAHADDAPNCNDPQSTADMNQCNDMAFDKADKELNALWPKMTAWAQDMDKNNDESDNSTYYADTLLASQRAWITFRDAECKVSGLPMHGGSGEGPLIGGCRAMMTQERVKSLKELLTP